MNALPQPSSEQIANALIKYIMPALIKQGKPVDQAKPVNKGA